MPAPCIHDLARADDSLDYLRRLLAGVLRFGVQRVAIGEQGGGVVMRVRFAAEAPPDRHLDVLVGELERDIVLEPGELHVQTQRHTTLDGSWTTIVRSRRGRLFAFMIHSGATGECVVTAMPLDETAEVR